MKRIVLAGGIGSGKSAACARLTELGWPVIDADEIAHQLTTPGQPVLDTLRDAFGDAVLADDGTLDRAFLADVVFNDDTALRRLNTITHGPIGLEILRRLDATNGPAAFVALPLFRPEHRLLLAVDEVWALQVEPATALARLVEGRGFSEHDARRRLESQMSNAERAAIVDRVIPNDGTLEELYQELARALEESGLARG
ncbi:MAG: dephospho-CoA kinase [Acidimicrobiales bacterium]|jgi:dephospho-CoA kinase